MLELLRLGLPGTVRACDPSLRAEFTTGFMLDAVGTIDVKWGGVQDWAEGSDGNTSEAQGMEEAAKGLGKVLEDVTKECGGDVARCACCTLSMPRYTGEGMLYCTRQQDDDLTALCGGEDAVGHKATAISMTMSSQLEETGESGRDMIQSGFWCSYGMVLLPINRKTDFLKIKLPRYVVKGTSDFVMQVAARGTMSQTPDPGRAVGYIELKTRAAFGDGSSTWQTHMELIAANLAAPGCVCWHGSPWETGWYP